MRARIRSAALALTGVAVVAALAACGDSDSGDDGAKTTAGTRTITDQFGTVTIEGTPERVVAIGNPESDTVVALGVIPVAMGQWLEEEDGASPWRREILGSERPEVIKWTEDGYDIEEILSFQPDIVIAGYDLEEDPYNRLSAVVPTMSMPYETSGEDLTRAIGKALGRDDEAELLIEETNEQLDAFKQANPQLDGVTVSIVDGGTPGVLYDATKSIIGLGMLERLGLKPAPGVEGLEDYAEVAAEKWASTFNGDLIIVNFPGEESRADLESRELFQRLPAVQAGHYLSTVDYNEQALLQSTALPQVRWALKNFVSKIVTAVE